MTVLQVTQSLKTVLSSAEQSFKTALTVEDTPKTNLYLDLGVYIQNYSSVFLDTIQFDSNITMLIQSYVDQDYFGEDYTGTAVSFN